MNSTVKTALVLITGAVAGFVISYKWNEKKWITRSEEDIKSAKAVHMEYRTNFIKYRKKVIDKYGEETDHGFMDEISSESTPISTVEKTNEILSESTKPAPTGYEKIYEDHPAFSRDINELPYVIKPEEYQKEKSYDVRLLTYYRDEGKLINPEDPATELDTRTILGEDVMEYLTTQWGTDNYYDDDTVYVEDDIVQIYYALTVE